MKILIGIHGHESSTCTRDDQPITSISARRKVPVTLYYIHMRTLVDGKNLVKKPASKLHSTNSLQPKKCLRVVSLILPVKHRRKNARFSFFFSFFFPPNYSCYVFIFSRVHVNNSAIVVPQTSSLSSKRRNHMYTNFAQLTF